MREPRKCIKQIVAATGDWFRVQIEHIPDGKDSVVMTRVTTWAVVIHECEDSATDEEVQGIDTGGFPEEDDYFRYYYVCGQDTAPNGKSWIAVFNDAPFGGWGWKEILGIEHPAR